MMYELNAQINVTDTADNGTLFSTHDKSTCTVERADVRFGYDPRCRNWYVQSFNNPSRVLMYAPYKVYGCDDCLIITLSKALRGKSGEVFGVAALDLNVKELNEKYKNH